jgi:type III secretion protein S
MNTSTVVDLTFQGLMLVLWLSLPSVVTAAVVGLIIAVFQATTQIQDQSISQAVKLIAVIIVVIITAKWMSAELYNFAELLFKNFKANTVTPPI